ncbi:MAG: hypothetical protein U9N51_11790, partial [Bacteroidota bacterium]|nr:hypothetical protein [Bacteroidota bacterium]
MKKIIFISTLLITSVLHSQETFNVILEDTITHIPSSIVESNDCYYVLSGTGSENNIRCYSITKINNLGEIQWKQIYANDSLEYWEGWEHSLKKSTGGFFTVGTANHTINNNKGFIFANFDQNLNLVTEQIVSYDTDWQKCFNSLKTDSNNIFITGQYYDTSLESFYMYISKYDSLNNHIWTQNYIDTYSYGSQVLECNNHDIICAGAQNSNGYTNWLINRYTTQGDLLWSKRFGWLGSRNDGSVSALAETSDSCILACGSYPGIKTAFDTYYDGCIRKIDENGELVWEQLYRSYLLSHTGSIYTTNNIYSIISDHAVIYAIGRNYNYNSWLDRAFLLKLNSHGEIIWKRNYFAVNEESHSQQITTFKQTSDNGFILCGYGNDYSNIGYDPPQQRWLIKTDSLGMDGLCNTEPDALQVDINLPEEMCAFDTTEQYLYIAGPTAPYTVNISNGQQFDSIYYPPVFVPKEIGPSTIEISYDGITTMEFEEPEVTISNHEWGECIAIPIEFHVGNQVG